MDLMWYRNTALVPVDWERDGGREDSVMVSNDVMVRGSDVRYGVTPSIFKLILAGYLETLLWHECMYVYIKTYVCVS